MLLAISLCALAPMSPMVEVLDVDPTTGPYFDISGAVLAASDGDVIRVAPGIYGSFAIRGKSLTIVGGPGVRVEGVVRVQELAADQFASLHGLELHELRFQSEERLILGYNQGAVRLEDVAVRMVQNGEYAYATDGVRVVQSDDVTFVSCEIGPKMGYDSTFNRLVGGFGLSVNQSRVSLFDCQVAGGGDAGFSAISGFGSTLELFGTTAQGGSGGYSYLTFAGNCRGLSGSGGHGVALGSSTLRTIDCTLLGGFRGIDQCYNYTYAPGLPVSLDANSIQVVEDGIAPLLNAPDLVPEGSTFTLDVESEPGDIVLLLVGAAPRRVEPIGTFGSLLIQGGAGYRRLLLGGGGNYQTTLTAPDLPPMETLTLHTQMVSLRDDPANPGSRRIIVAAPQVITILDSAF